MHGSNRLRQVWVSLNIGVHFLFLWGYLAFQICWETILQNSTELSFSGEVLQGQVLGMWEPWMTQWNNKNPHIMQLTFVAKLASVRVSKLLMKLYMATSFTTNSLQLDAAISANEPICIAFVTVEDNANKRSHSDLSTSFVLFRKEIFLGEYL